MYVILQYALLVLILLKIKQSSEILHASALLTMNVPVFNS